MQTCCWWQQCSLGVRTKVASGETLHKMCVFVFLEKTMWRVSMNWQKVYARCNRKKWRTRRKKHKQTNCKWWDKVANSPEYSVFFLFSFWLLTGKGSEVIQAKKIDASLHSIEWKIFGLNLCVCVLLLVLSFVLKLNWNLWFLHTSNTVSGWNKFDEIFRKKRWKMKEGAGKKAFLCFISV